MKKILVLYLLSLASLSFSYDVYLTNYFPFALEVVPQFGCDGAISPPY